MDEERKKMLAKWLGRAERTIETDPILAYCDLELIREFLPDFGTAEDMGTTEAHLSELYKTANLKAAEHWHQRVGGENEAAKHEKMAREEVTWGRQRQV